MKDLVFKNISKIKVLLFALKLQNVSGTQNRLTNNVT